MSGRSPAIGFIVQRPTCREPRICATRCSICKARHRTKVCIWENAVFMSFFRPTVRLLLHPPRRYERLRETFALHVWKPSYSLETVPFYCGQRSSVSSRRACSSRSRIPGRCQKRSRNNWADATPRPRLVVSQPATERWAPQQAMGIVTPNQIYTRAVL